jgi:hypothetical protein
MRPKKEKKNTKEKKIGTKPNSMQPEDFSQDR